MTVVGATAGATVGATAGDGAGATVGATAGATVDATAGAGVTVGAAARVGAGADAAPASDSAPAPVAAPSAVNRSFYDNFQCSCRMPKHSNLLHRAADFKVFRTFTPCFPTFFGIDFGFDFCIDSLSILAPFWETLGISFGLQNLLKWSDPNPGRRPLEPPARQRRPGVPPDPQNGRPGGVTDRLAPGTEPPLLSR